MSSHKHLQFYFVNFMKPQKLAFKTINNIFEIVRVSVSNEEFEHLHNSKKLKNGVYLVYALSIIVDIANYNN